MGVFGMRFLPILHCTTAILLVTLSTIATAAETTTYTYDALGRLVRTTQAGGPATGVDVQTDYDPAGNRTNVAVTGAATSSPPFRVIVLPLNGYTVIPIGN